MNVETVYQDIRLQQNTDYTSDTYSYVDAASVVIPITGWTAVLTIKTSNSESGSALLTLTQASGITLSGSLGQFVYNITAAQALTLPIGVYWYDLFLVDAATPAKRHKLLAGNCYVEASNS